MLKLIFTMGFLLVRFAWLNVQLAFQMCISNVVYQKHLILLKMCMLFILLYDLHTFYTAEVKLSLG